MSSEAKKKFGRAIGAWLAKNEWPQRITEEWATLANSAGPWSSQMSQCVNNRFHPRVEFFTSLGQFNETIGEKAKLRAIGANGTLLERMLHGVPFLTAEDQPAGAMDFFGMYVGLLPIPAQYLQLEERVSKEMIAEVFSEVDRAINLVAMETMQDRREVLKRLDEDVFVPEFAEYRDELRQQVLGITTFPIKRFDSFVRHVKAVNAEKGMPDRGCPITSYCLEMLREASAPLSSLQETERLHENASRRAQSLVMV